MNEELRIIIRAVTADAKKNIADVKKQLSETEKQSKSTGKSLGEALKSAGKAAAVAVAAFAAVTAAMVQMGKSSDEYVKAMSRVKSSFQAVGSDATEAVKTYQQLYRFLGDTGTASEAAALLSKLTTNTQHLSEWTNILQGVYATFPDSLPIESLAEATNETVKTGKVTGTLADAINWLGVSEDAVNEKLATMTSLQEREAFLRSTLNGLYSGAAAAYERNNASMMALNDSQARLDEGLAAMSAYITPLRIELNNLSAVLISVLGPAFKYIAAVLVVLVQWLVTAIQYIGTFFGLFGKSGVEATKSVAQQIESVKQNATGVGESFKNATKAAEKLKRATAGFDEINVVSSPVSSSSSSGGSGGSGGATGGLGIAENLGSFEVPGLTEFQETVEGVKGTLSVILPLLGSIAAVFLTIKFVNWWKDLGTAKGVLADVVDLIEDLGGIDTFTDLPQDIQDSFNNAKKGVENITNPLKNVAGTVSIIAGMALLLWGYSDSWVNGVDWGGFAAVLGGIALIVTGLFLKFQSLGGGIGLIAGGIAAVVLAIKDMTTNGASLQNVLMLIAGVLATVAGVMVLLGKETIKTTASWIANTAAMVANKIALVAQNAATIVVTVAQTALNLVMSLSPITWIIAAIVALIAIFVVLWNKCEWFRDLWKGAWEGIKKAFNAVVGFIKENWQAMLLFLVNPLAGIFKYLYDNFDGFRQFIDGIVDKIKSAFTKIPEAIAAVWSKVKAVFSKGGEVFDKIKDGILNGFKTIVNGIIDGLNKVVKIPFEGINKALTKIKSVSIAGVKPFSWMPTITIPQIPKLAKGGITTRATTAIIGEAGKEAVLPLENNTQWMDKLADRLASRTQTPTKVVLQVGEKELGWATIGAINGITQQTGRIQLAI